MDTHDPNIFPDGYPQTATPADVVAMVLPIHGREEDWDEGDLEDRIYTSPSYTLTDLPLDRLDLDEWAVDADFVAELAQEIAEGRIIAPIVFCTDGDTIIDGIHRANALHALGRSTVLAYVGEGGLE